LIADRSSDLCGQQLEVQKELVVDKFSAGEDLQQTNQPDDQAGS